jgi:hypothetical protein
VDVPEEIATRVVVDGSGCKHSFLPDTDVLLANGNRKDIEDVKVGDEVTVTDPHSGETTTRPVVAAIVTEDDKDFVDLTIDTPSGPASLISTVNHPFWSETGGNWVEAGDLTPGELLRTAEGDTVRVVEARHFRKQQRTHDLTVRDVHTYYVLAGASPVLVHNCGGALLDRARELHATRADEASTVAVARVRNVHNPDRVETWVATERTGLPDEWKRGNAPLRGERYIPGQGHAEATIMNRLGSDWEILGMASSTRMCPACFAQATGPGVSLTPSSIGKGLGVSNTGNTPWRVVLRGDD